MADKVNELLDRFAALSKEEKQLSADMDTAFKEYTDYCSSSEVDLNEKIEEIHKKMGKLDYYIDYAREHAQASELEEAPEAFETPDGTLESIRQTIKLDSHNDVNAETLYTKATGMKKFYEQKIEQTRQLIEGSKVQAKRQYDSDMASLNERKDKHDAEIKEYIASDAFKEFLKTLSEDKSAFNSTGTANLSDRTCVSLGQRRMKLTVPMEIEQDLSMSSNGEYNSAAHTIGAPVRVSVERGSVLYLDFDDKNSQYLMGGVQRLMLNLIRYYGSDINEMLFCEPQSLSPDCLGAVSALAKGANSFIKVPSTAEDIDGAVMEFCGRAAAEPLTDKVSRVIVLHCFPEKYSFSVKDRILELCEKASERGVLVVLTHNNSVEETELEQKIRENALSIRSRNGGFWIEQHRESFFWYSAPSELSEDVRRIYIDLRRRQAQSASEVKSEPTAEAPVQSVQPVQPASTASTTPEPVEQAERVENVEKAETAEPVEKVEEAPEPAPAPAPKPRTDWVSPAERAAKAKAPAGPTFTAKGKRVLPRVEIGRDMENMPKYIDISGSVSYVCGSIGEERRRLVDIMAGRIISGTHPDDAELWVFDFVGDLKKYASTPASHVKYLVCDNSSETVLDITDAIVKEFDRRLSVFGEKGWKSIGSVPAQEYMPQIIVIINCFPTFAQIFLNMKMFGRNNSARLNRVFKNCGGVGMHFVLFGDTFSDDGARPACFKNCTIHSAAAIANHDPDIRVLFSGFKAEGDDAEQLRKIPSGCAFVADENIENGLSLVKISAAPEIRIGEYTAVEEYVPDAGSFVYKSPVILDSTHRVPFEERAARRETLISRRGSDEILLFLGEPCRIMQEYPVRLLGGFGENVLMIAPAREREGAAAVIRAAVMSLCEQGIPAEILAFRSNPVYAELARTGLPEGITVYEDNAAAARVKELSAAVAEGKTSNAFEIVLGGELLMAQMHSEDSMGDLKRVLVKGAAAGVHFLFAATGSAHAANGFTALFRHKIVFSCPLSDAEKVLHSVNCELSENAFRLSDDYDELTMVPYLI